MKKTATRWFQVIGENKTTITVQITTKDYTDILEAILPKNEIKILQRVYGFGGSKTAEIEFPISMQSLFLSIYPVKDIVDHFDGTYSFTHLGKRFISTVDVMEALKRVRE